MSCVNIVVLSCWLGAKLSVTAAEATKAVIENYLVNLAYFVLKLKTLYSRSSNHVISSNVI